MKIALIGAELEENLGLRYMASSLESRGHQVEIVPFNTRNDIPNAIDRIRDFSPRITGLSMVFTSRAPEFIRLAQRLREDHYCGHIIAGGHFAAFNGREILERYPAFDSVALGEGEHIICALADALDDVSGVSGLYWRRPNGEISLNSSSGNPEDLDALPFPKRSEFHDYYGKKIASILSSRGCWRDCAFCSINAWYKSGGGKKFRIRSIDNIVAEMKELYFKHGVRIFSFQDDNFFLPDKGMALERFERLRSRLSEEGVAEIAIAIKARPDSITRESVRVLDELGLFRVFLGVENASQRGLDHLNRKCTVDQIVRALEILNDIDVHVAFNLLMFEPDTTTDDILVNLRFIERHLDNPLNFCRAEPYAGTELAAKLSAEGLLLGDLFGFDYRLKDARSEIFHKIANDAFFERNFTDLGLHYFNMQVDFCYQLLRRFYPQAHSQALHAMVRSFIKRTNLDTHIGLSQIYDFVKAVDTEDHLAIEAFASRTRMAIKARSRELYEEGSRLLEWMDSLYEQERQRAPADIRPRRGIGFPDPAWGVMPYHGLDNIPQDPAEGQDLPWLTGLGSLGLESQAIPYGEFKKRLAAQSQERG